MESFLQGLSSSPGVYIFENEDRVPLYIGKSIHIRTRIRQHLKSSQSSFQKQSHFVKLTKTLRVYPLPSELEAILLEAKLIKLHQPKYNVIQKDDKSSLYITITKNEDFPKVAQSRKTDIDPKDVDFYGPYSNSTQTQTILRLSRRLFNFCANPPSGNKKMRPCFYYHLNLCSGACVGTVTASDYKKQITNLKRFLNGQTKAILENFIKDINRSVKHKDFETAARIKQNYVALFSATQLNKSIASFLSLNPQRDRQLKNLRDVLKAYNLDTSLERIEVYDMATLNQKDSVGSMIVFRFGEAQKSEYRKFKIKTSQKGDPYMMKEVLERRFNHPEWETPNLIILDGGKPQLSIAGTSIPKSVSFISIAKKEETLIIPRGDGTYDEILLPKSSPALKLVQQMRDEAHRFATTYHKKIKQKTSLNLG